MKSFPTRTLTLAMVAALVAAAPGSASASVTLVTSRAALGANDLIDWGQLGPSFTQITNPVTVTSTGGNTAITAQVSGNGERRDQGFGWAGNFAPGDRLYWTQYGFNSNDQGPVTLTFNKFMSGAGAQVQENFFGGFTAFISAHDSSHNLLGTFTENGLSTPNGDNSAIFIGVSSSSANIASVTFGLTSAQVGNTADFAINQVSLVSSNAVPVPEPSSLAIAGIGAIFFTFFAWRRRG
jgi:hypothetical protein